MKTQLRIDFEKWYKSYCVEQNFFTFPETFDLDSDGDYRNYVVDVAWKGYRAAFAMYAPDQFMLYDETGSPARPVPDIPDRGDQF